MASEEEGRSPDIPPRPSPALMAASSSSFKAGQVEPASKAFVLGAPLALSFEELVQLSAERPLLPEDLAEKEGDPLLTATTPTTSSSHVSSANGSPSSGAGGIGVQIERSKWCRIDHGVFRIAQGSSRRHMLYDVVFYGRSIGLTLSFKEHVYVQALTGIGAFRLGLIAKGDIIISASCEERWIRCNETLQDLTDFIVKNSRPIVLRFWRRPEPIQLGQLLISNGPFEVFLNFVNRYLDSANYKEIARNERALLEKTAKEGDEIDDDDGQDGEKGVEDDIEGSETADETTDDEVVTDLDSHTSTGKRDSASRKFLNSAVAQVFFLVEIVKIRQRIKTGGHRQNQTALQNSIKKGVAVKYLSRHASDFSIRDVLKRDRRAAVARKEVLTTGSLSALDQLYDYVHEFVRNDTFALFLHERDVEQALEKLGEKNGWKLRMFSQLVRQIVPLPLICEKRKTCYAFMLFLLGLPPTRQTIRCIRILSLWLSNNFSPTIFDKMYIPLAKSELLYDDAAKRLDVNETRRAILEECKEFHRNFVHHSLGKVVFTAFNSAAKMNGNVDEIEIYMPRLSALLTGAQLEDHMNTHRAVNKAGLERSFSMEDRNLDSISVAHALFFEAGVKDAQDPKLFNFHDVGAVPPQIERFFMPHRHEPERDDELASVQDAMLFNFIMGDSLYGCCSFRKVEAGMGGPAMYRGICVTTYDRRIESLRGLVAHLVSDEHVQAILTSQRDLEDEDYIPLKKALKTAAAVPVEMPFIPEGSRLRKVDFKLAILFEIFSFEDIALLFESCLLERKILFVSCRYSALTIVMESLRELLSPLQWSHVFAPVLPRKMLEHLQCPTPFMIGIHTDYAFKKDFPFVLDAVIVDFDRGTIQMPSLTARGNDSLAAYDEESSAGLDVCLPDDFRADLVQDLRTSTQKLFQFADSLKDESAEEQFVKMRDTSVRLAFRRLVMRLLDKVTKFCIPISYDRADSLMIFNEKAFLENIPQAKRRFFASFIRTQGFSSYVSSFLDS